MPATPSIRNKYTNMQVEQATLPFSIEFRETFDALYVYTLVYEWLCDNMWHKRDDENFPEILYIERTDQKGSQEIIVKWRLKKPVAGAPEHFVKQHLDIDFHFLSLKKHEIIHKGKKYPTNKGEVIIIVNPYLVFDKQWEKNNLLKTIKKLFQKRVLVKKIEMWKDALKNDAHRLREAISTYLKIQNYYPEKEVGEFWAKKTGE